MTTEQRLMLELIQAYREHDKHTIRRINARLSELRKKS